MSRIAATFAALQRDGRKALVPYICCGDPFADATPQIMQALADGGADVIELGVPFSDPMADGPVIQLSSERALLRKVGLRQVLQFVREFRATDATTPLVLMGYLNPLELYGVPRFAKDAAEAGVDGLLIVDCPPEEAGPLREALEANGLQQILLAAPTSSDERVAQLLRETRGYLYYVSFAGVTGAAGLDIASVGRRLAAVRQGSATPVAVGFGVRDAESARGVAAFADAVVIGSALVQVLADAEGPEDAANRAGSFLRPIRAALDAGPR
jgi:tryptophan synthase alpha chain